MTTPNISTQNPPTAWSETRLVMSTKVQDNKVALVALGVLGSLFIGGAAYYFFGRSTVKAPVDATSIENSALEETHGERIKQIGERINRFLLELENIPQHTSISALESWSEGIKATNNAIGSEVEEAKKWGGSEELQEIEQKLKRLTESWESKKEAVVALLETKTQEIQQHLEQATQKEALQCKKESEALIRIGSNLEPKSAVKQPTRFITVLTSLKKVKQSAKKKVTPTSQSKHKIEIDLPHATFLTASKEYKTSLDKLLLIENPSSEESEEMELLFVQISEHLKSVKKYIDSTPGLDQETLQDLDISKIQLSKLCTKIANELEMRLNLLQDALNKAYNLTNEQFDQYLESARKIRETAISIQSNTFKEAYERLLKETVLIWHDQKDELEVYMSAHWEAFNCPDPASIIQILQPIPPFNEAEQKKLKIESFLEVLNLSTVKAWKVNGLCNRERIEVFLRANKAQLLNLLTKKWPSLLSESTSPYNESGSVNQGRRGVLASTRKK